MFKHPFVQVMIFWIFYSLNLKGFKNLKAQFVPQFYHAADDRYSQGS